MKVEVLISCMHQKDASIIKRTNIQSDVVVVNQCNENKIDSFIFTNKKGESCVAKIIYTTERGLSKSRNMAIRNASGDICLLCDDDEVMEDDYVEKIIQAFEDFPQKTIITFKLHLKDKELPSKSYPVRYFQTAKIASWQIAFRRSTIDIYFNEKMGSGTGNGGGEENKFLVDNLKKGHKIQYVPFQIASLVPENSQWFHGYDKKYWINRGWAARMIFGYIGGYMYLWYCILFRNRNIDKYNSWFKIIGWLHIGFIDKR